MGPPILHVWYCAYCGDGPHSYALQVGCPMCGLLRGPTSVTDYTPTQSKLWLPPPSPPAPTYAQPSNVVAQMEIDAESKSPLLGNLDTERHESVPPKDLTLETTSHPSSEASFSPPYPDSQTDYEIPDYDVDEAARHVLGSRSVKQRAKYLSDLILGGVRLDINFEAKIITCAGNRNSPTSTQGGHATQSSSSHAGNRSSDSGSGAKRRRDKGQDEAGEGERSGSNKRVQTRRPKPTEESNKEPLACPFYKRNPRKCARYRACAGPGWVECYRLKEHLFRNHLIYQCLRCSTTFPTTKDLDEHQQQFIACPSVRPQRPVFAINQSTREKLRDRKPHENREACWRWMFSEIFPSVPHEQIPSPYYGDESKCEDDPDSDDDTAAQGNERLCSLFRSSLPSRTFEHLERRIRLMMQNNDSTYQDILRVVQRGEFHDLLKLSILEAIEELRQADARPRQQQPLISENGVARTAEESNFFEPSRNHREPDRTLNTLHGSSTSSFRDPFPTEWTVNLDLSDFDINTALEDMDKQPQPADDFWVELFGGDILTNSEVYVGPTASETEMLPLPRCLTSNASLKGPTGEEGQRGVGADQHAYLLDFPDSESDLWLA